MKQFVVGLLIVLSLTACSRSRNINDVPETTVDPLATYDSGEPSESSSREPATVRRIVDGDTFRVCVPDCVESESKETVVRLLGIDTPETLWPGRPVECWGPEATQTAKDLLPIGSSIYLVLDPEEDDKDRYDRWLRYVWIGDVFINEEMVRSGAAKFNTKYPPSPQYHATLFQGEAEAQSSDVGMWGPPCDADADGM